MLKELVKNRSFEWHYSSATPVKKVGETYEDTMTGKTYYARDVLFNTPNGLVNQIGVLSDNSGINAIEIKIKLNDEHNRSASVTYRFKDGIFSDFTYILFNKWGKQDVRLDQEELYILPFNPLASEMGPIFQELEGENHYDHLGKKGETRVTGIAQAFDDIYQRHERRDLEQKQFLESYHIRG